MHYTTVELGEAEITDKVSTDQLDTLKDVLKMTWLELMDDSKKFLLKKSKP